jgi:integrase
VNAAERLSAEIRERIVLGAFDYAATFPNSKYAKAEPAPIATFSEYAETWKKTLTGEKSTLLGYRSQMQTFWIPELGDKPLPEVKHSDIATAVAKKAAAGATAKTTNNLLIPIRALFAAAEADGLVETNPATKVHNRRHQKEPPDPFMRGEMERILAHMEEHYHSAVVNYFEFAFMTGMRSSELIALRWGDVDWNNRTIQVRRALVRHQTKGTKTHSVRDVDLNDLAHAALIRQKQHTFMRGPNEPIFSCPEGKPWLSERRLREQFFQPTLKACGIRQRKAYNTRHTYATVALMSSINPAYIARQLGHTTPAMLFKHYAKWIVGADSGAEAKKLNNVFNASKGSIGIGMVSEKTNAN